VECGGEGGGVDVLHAEGGCFGGDVFTGSTTG